MEIIQPSLYKIVDVNNQSDIFKTVAEHIKYMKKSICERKETLYKDGSNIDQNFIMKQIGLTREESSRFILAIYQYVILYGKKSKRPTAILFYKTSSKNNSYIVSLLCRHQLAQSGYVKF